jgi:hypothetical protein
VRATVNRARQTPRAPRRSGTVRRLCPAGAILALRTTPADRATTTCGRLKSDGSLASRTDSRPPGHATRVYVTFFPDHVSFGYSPSTFVSTTSGPRVR